MANCSYCEKVMPNGAVLNTVHDECNAEWGSRYDGHRCTHCGDCTTRRLSIYCGKCGLNSPYRGYENCYQA